MTTYALASRSPRDPQSKLIAIPLTPDEIKITDTYASSECRSRASFARMLYLSALANYEANLRQR